MFIKLVCSLARLSCWPCCPLSMLHSSWCCLLLTLLSSVLEAEDVARWCSESLSEASRPWLSQRSRPGRLMPDRSVPQVRVVRSLRTVLTLTWDFFADFQLSIWCQKDSLVLVDHILQLTCFYWDLTGWQFATCGINAEFTITSKGLETVLKVFLYCNISFQSFSLSLIWSLSFCLAAEISHKK